ncbi:hypothetical protein TNCV_735681 [Trichonephila clavipes]|uniref:Uncharacterized protein n=1 Tax=Trichonephila clavipes TaxID=2585209 RepID=A0A8X6VQ24_TRICX|nr:hypothetical protein TNCV_735681 [Trichonephila clavipes]
MISITTVRRTNDGNKGCTSGRFAVHTPHHAAVFTLIGRSLDTLNGQSTPMTDLLAVMERCLGIYCVEVSLSHSIIYSLKNMNEIIVMLHLEHTVHDLSYDMDPEDLDEIYL